MRKGNIALTTVIIVTALLLSSGIAFVLTSIDLAQTSKNYNFADLTQIRARTCIEESLYRIKTNLNYTGTFSLSFSDGNCNSTVQQDANVSLKDIIVTSSINSYTYSITKKVNTTITPLSIIN